MVVPCGIIRGCLTLNNCRHTTRPSASCASPLGVAPFCGHVAPVNIARSKNESSPAVPTSVSRRRSRPKCLRVLARSTQNRPNLNENVMIFCRLSERLSPTTRSVHRLLAQRTPWRFGKAVACTKKEVPVTKRSAGGVSPSGEARRNTNDVFGTFDETPVYFNPDFVHSTYESTGGARISTVISYIAVTGASSLHSFCACLA